MVAILFAGCGSPQQSTPTERSDGGIVQINQKPGPNPWTDLQFRNNPDNFQFAIISDITGRLRPNIFPDAVRKLNLLQPEFVMTMGDVIEGHTSDPKELNRQWTELFKAVKPLQMPLFWVPGNHDYWYQSRQNAAARLETYDMRAVYKARVGRPWFHFIYRNVLFLILNNTMRDPTEIKEQEAFVRKVLKQNSNVRWTFTFFHYDIFQSNRPGNVWAFMKPLLAGRPYTAFAANNHTYLKHSVGKGKNMIRLATTGGMSRMRGPAYGEFDHIMWVTMTDDGPKITNLMLNGIYDSNVRTEKSAQMTNLLLDGVYGKKNKETSPITSKPILVNGDTFDGATTTLHITNPADIPLHMQGTFEANNQLRAEPSSFDLEVPGKTQKDVDLTVHVSKAVSVYDVNPLVLDWQAGYKLSGNDPDVTVNGRHRIIIDTTGERRPPQWPVVTENFSGKLDPAWLPLGPGGAFDGQGRFTLRDNPPPLQGERKDAQGRYTDGPLYEVAVHTPVPKRVYRFTDGRGIFTMTPLFELPVNGVYRNIPPDSFEADLKVSQMQLKGKDPEFHWEFWDEPDQIYNYGPAYLSGVLFTVSQEFGTYVLKLRHFRRTGYGVTEKTYTYTDLGTVKLDSAPSSMALRARWRESSRSWQFFYGLDGADAVTPFPGGAFVENVNPSPEGKINLIYMRREYVQGGSSIALDDYRLLH